ncbi:MAG: phage/plasmid primase, P4 family [Candidatus Solibacter sp.]
MDLYRDALEIKEGVLALFTIPAKNCFTSGDVVELRDRAIKWSGGTQNVYIHTHLHKLPLGDQQGRGSKKTASVAIGIVSDIDARGPGRNKPPETLCPTVADAIGVAQEFSRLFCPVSLTINSGHGGYPLLLFREPLELHTEIDRQRLNAIARRYHEALCGISSGHGWTGAVDFCDLAKVIRLPGTINAKDPNSPMPVRIVGENSARYNLSDLEEILPETAAKLFSLPSKPVGTSPVPATNTKAVETLRLVPPDPEIINLLVEGDPIFAATWKHDRPDLRDQSCSGYDMALAKFGVICELDDNHIAGLIDDSRRRFTRPKQDRKGAHYQTYLAGTIDKARAWEAAAKPVEDVQAEPDNIEAGTVVAVVEAVEAAPEKNSLDESAEEKRPAEPTAERDAVESSSSVAQPTAQAGSPTEHAHKSPALKMPITKSQIVKSVSDRLVSEFHFARDAAEQLYCYENGLYLPTDFMVRRQTQLLLEKAGLSGKWSSHRGCEVVNYTMLKSPSIWEGPPCNEINLKNGILDVRTGKLRPHSPEFLSPIQIPVKYDEAATCPAWDRFIAEVFPADCVDLAWEILGDLMTPDRSIQKAGLLVGEGGNGKSVFLNGCTAFVGHRNVSSVPLHKLEGDRFSVSRLYGKLVNCCADLPSGDLESTSMFKALTGGDIVTGERKYENSFDFKPYARLLFSANHPPRSNDASSAFFDRWLVIPFARSFRGTNHERSRGELDAILADARELSGVMNRALPALKRLRERGRFTETQSTTQALAEMRQVTDPLAVWLEVETVTHPNASVPCSVLLIAYNQDCSRRARPAINQTAFGQAIRHLRSGIEVKKRGPKGEQRDCYIGIGLKADAPFPQGVT